MRKEGRYQILSSFWLRLIGMVTMTLDHIGLLFLYDPDPGIAQMAYIFRIIGRIAMPIFAFLMAEGMRYTHDKRLYILRVAGLTAIISIPQAIAMYAMNMPLDYMPNPLLDLFFLILVLYCLTHEKIWVKFLSILPAGVMIASFVIGVIETNQAVTVFWWPFAFRPAYNMLVLLWGIGFYYAPIIMRKILHSQNQSNGISDELYEDSPYGRQNANFLGCFFFFLTVLSFWGLSYVAERSIDPLGMSMESWCLLAILPLLLYSGRKGYGPLWWKIFSYAYFPVHLIILFLIFGL